MPVESGMAGDMIPCSCGRTIKVPSLSKLRSMSGVASPELQPDFEVEVLLAKNLLPLESTCVECGKPTNQVVSVYVECSRVTIVPPRSRTNLLMTALLWPVVAFFLYYWGQQRRLARERGTDRIYRPAGTTLTVAGSGCFSGTGTTLCGTTAGNIYYNTANTAITTRRIRVTSDTATDTPAP